ncbi:hypothetical protein CHARACLAT_029115 [Characodon lateralis]|uniref:Uncharacterized protein n=1 Tax=Characodon lateralis TaxID=208331 RepID=A0ABU7CS81_9TELE|nr:hypothetical protein [Characodon lateralis]
MPCGVRAHSILEVSRTRREENRQAEKCRKPHLEHNHSQSSTCYVTSSSRMAHQCELWQEGLLCLSA